MAFDTTRLINQINLKACLPEGRFADQEILDAAYDVLLSEIVPTLLNFRSDYFVTYSTVTIAAGTTSFDIPYRALNGVLREVKLVDGANLLALEQTTLDGNLTTTEGTPTACYLTGNSIVLSPVPNAATTLRVYYYLRPSRLVPVIETAKIVSINDSTVTIASTPTGWDTTSMFDIVKGKAHFDILAMDLTVTGISNNTITFSSTVDSKIAVGDYVCLSEETCFPYLPPENHVALIQATSASLLESIGAPTATVFANKAGMLLEKISSIQNSRIEEPNLTRTIF